MSLAVVLLVSVAFSCDCSRISRRSTTNTKANSSAGVIFKSTGDNNAWIKTHANKILAQGVNSVKAIVVSGNYSFGNIAKQALSFGIAALGVVNPLLGAITGLFLGIFGGLFGISGGGNDDLERMINVLITERIWKERTAEIAGVFKAHVDKLSDCCSPSENNPGTFLDEVDYIRRNQYTIFRECYTNLNGATCRKWQAEGGGGSALEYALMFAESEIQIRIHIIGMDEGEKEHMLKLILKYGREYDRRLTQHFNVFAAYRKDTKWMKYTWNIVCRVASHGWYCPGQKTKAIDQRDTFADREMIASKCLRHGTHIKSKPHASACFASYNHEVIMSHLWNSAGHPIVGIRHLALRVERLLAR